MNILAQIFAFLFAIFILVTIHEYGHFLVARRMGVKVLRFSIGFGKILWRWHDKKGTEYAISLLPLGGYVKLLDERETRVSAEETPQEFNHKSIWTRFLILVAGPLTNWLLAIFIIWIIFMIGFDEAKPIIGQVTPNSIAAQAGLHAGDKILAIDDRLAPSWQKVFMGLAYRLGEKSQMKIEVLPPNSPSPQTYSLDLSHWQVNGLNPDPLGSLGIQPYQPPLPAIVDKIMPSQAAAKAGLLSGDHILSINNRPVIDWYDLIKFIQANPNKTVSIVVQRGQQHLTLPLTIGERYANRLKPIGFIGVQPIAVDIPKDMQFRLQYTPLKGLIAATKETISFSMFNFVLLGKMLVGHVSLQGLGGPVTIFNSAKSAFGAGLLSYFSFIAIFSTMLAVINVLPIPGLDGGHILMLLIEKIRGRALQLTTQLWIYRIGMLLLVFIMIQALVNDVMRLF